MQPHRLALGVFIAFWFGATARTAEIAVENDLVYGKAGDVGLKLDLAQPTEGDGPFPAIVFIHGGGWHAGNRQGYLGQIEEAARRGYVAVTITYRLRGPFWN